MASLAKANPFFQEFQVSFREPALGMVVQNINNLPTVKQVFRETSGSTSDPNEAERGGVTAGCVISGVNSDDNCGLKIGYKETIGKIKKLGRPVTLTFRRLHAVEDPHQPRRYWQGYLRSKCGPQWTGRFYVLRENGCLLSYPGKDITGQDAIETFENIHEGSVISGEVLRRASEMAPDYKRMHPERRRSHSQSAHDLSVPETLSEEGMSELMIRNVIEAASSVLKDIVSPNDLNFWQTIFAVCMKGSTDVHLFRAESSNAKTDWICAITTLVVVKDLSLEKSTSVSDSTNRTEAIGAGVPRAVILKQGYLKHHKQNFIMREHQKLLRLSPKQRWFVVQDNGRLLWYRSLPSDASELPAGSLDLRHSELSTDPAKIAEHLISANTKEDSGGVQSGQEMTMIITPLQNEGRGVPLILTALSPLDRTEWVNSMVVSSQGLVTALPHISEDAQTARFAALKSIQEEPDILFKSPEVAFALMIGRQSGGGILKEDFVKLAGQYFIPLCDAFTADLVFTTLVSQYEAIKKAFKQESEDRMISVGDKLAQWGSICSFDMVDTGDMMAQWGSVTDLVTNWAEGYFSGVPMHTETKTRIVDSEPLVEGIQMPFSLFRKYVNDVMGCSQIVDPWGELRVRLNLNPNEVLVKWEDFVSDNEQLGSMLTHSGRLFLTDRHVFLHKGLQAQVLVIPLSSIKEVRQASRQAGFSKEDDVVELQGCRVHTIHMKQEEKHSEKEQHVDTEDIKVHDTVPFKLVFSKMLDMFGKPAQKRQGRRNIWFYMLREMVEAHKLTMELLQFNVASPLTPGSFLDSIGSKIADIQSGWSEHLDNNRLPLWAAANLIRSRALARTTERFTTTLMICSYQQIPQNQNRLWQFLNDHALTVKVKVNSPQLPHKQVNKRSEKPTAQPHLGFRFRSSSSPAPNTDSYHRDFTHNSEPLMNNARWFQILVQFLSHTREYEKMQKRFIGEFDSTKFKEEWTLFWEFFDNTRDYWIELFEKIFDWEDPLLSGVLLLLALAIAWHDLTNYLVPLFLLAQVVYILVSGSMQCLQRSQKSGLQKQREMARLQDLADQQNRSRFNDSNFDEEELNFSSAMSDDNDSDCSELHDSPIPAPYRKGRCVSEDFTLPEDASSRLKFWAQRAFSSKSTAKSPGQIQDSIWESSSSKKAAQSKAPPSQKDQNAYVDQDKNLKQKSSEDQGILNLIHTIKAKLGEVQQNVHDYNTFFLKCRSLYTWVDGLSTKIYIVLLLLLAMALAFIPFRYIYTGIVVFLFTKPIRDEEPPLPILLLQHFAKGIPVESNTHTNLKMESIYRSEEIGQQLAMKKKKMQGSRVRIHS